MILPKTIKVSENLSVEAAFERLKADGKLPAEPYLYKGPFGNMIYVPGAGDNDIQISIVKGKMTIGDAARPKGMFSGMVKEEALAALTGGWSKILSKKPSNKELFEKVSAECMRLFEAA